MYLLYFCAWLIFAGSITIEICLFGLIIAAAIFIFTCKFMDYSVEKEKKMIKKAGKFLWYVIVLIKEILLANVQTIRLILSEKEEVKPVLVDFETDLTTEMGKVLLANSITLTPGTITVEVDENGYLVHCLDESLAGGMEESEFVKLIRKLEKE